MSQDTERFLVVAKSLLENIEETGANVLGVVSNDLPPDTRYYYSGYYGYGYFRYKYYTHGKEKNEKAPVEKLTS